MHSISSEDAQYIAEIQSGEIFFELRDESGILLQSLIPLGEEMGLHLVRRDNGSYRYDIVPLYSQISEKKVSLKAGTNLHASITELTDNDKLPGKLAALLQNNDLFKKLRPNDSVAFIYTQKEYLGNPLGTPHIKAALIKTGGKEYFAFVDKQGNIYHSTHKTVFWKYKEKRPFTYTTLHKIPSKNFRMPVEHPRITSRFTYRRWHPILHKYRPHFGVDFGARRGTPIKAVNDGKVIFAGWMRGYGKVTKIDHGRGFVSLYAHQSKILVKKGQQVRRGDTIGRVGSTGRSTGPHLHLGLYLRNKPVDPLKYIARKGTGAVRILKKKHTVMKEVLVTKHKQIELKNGKRLKKELEKLMENSSLTVYGRIKTKNTFVKLSDMENDSNTKEEDNG